MKCSNKKSYKNKTKQSSNITILYSIVSFLILTTMTAGFVLASTVSYASDNSTSTTASVTVSAACTLFSSDGGNYNVTLEPGNTVEVEGSHINATCNDASGYAIYAIGFSGETYEGNNTDMIASIGNEYNIPTNLSGTDSWWAMKIVGAGTIAPSIDNNYTNYQKIPATYTRISYTTTSITDANSSITTPTYKINLASNQPAGTYTGKVKYTLVHPSTAEAPTPLRYMQDQTQATLATLMPNIGDEIILYDKRDDQEYTIAKLADGKYWMTSNLNIAGGTALSSDDTDFDSTYTLPTTDGWTVSNGKLILPASSTSFGSTGNIAKLYNSGNTTTNQSDCTSSKPCNSYYSWDAATLGSGRSITTNGTNAPYSICPKGWRLPTTTTSNADPRANNNWKTGDWYALATAYGANLESDYSDSSSATGANFYNNAGPGTTPNFLLAGIYQDSFKSGGSDVLYWSATSYNGDVKHFFHFTSSSVELLNPLAILVVGSRWNEMPVRCVYDVNVDVRINFDGGVSSVYVGGVAVIESESAVSLTPESVYSMQIDWADGYMADSIAVISGDATVDELTLNSGTGDSVVNITSQPAKNVNVGFTFSNTTSVAINGETITTSGGTVSLMGGRTYTVTVTPASNYTLSANGGTITSGSYYTISNVNTGSKTFELTVGNNDGVIAISTQSCITADTLITLANGDKKRVADLTGDEELLVWDFDTASYSSAPIVFIEPEPEAEYDIIHLFFEDESDVEISYEHGFFDYTLGKFIYINYDNPEQYIGHQFVMQDKDTYKTVTLTEIKHEKKITSLYGLTTYKHFNFFNNDMLSIEGNITGMFNYFDVDLATMGYDQAKKQADIEKYGLLTYEDFGGMIDELGFEAYNGQYLNVSIGKGLTTWDDIKALADYYGHFTANAR